MCVRVSGPLVRVGSASAQAASLEPAAYTRSGLFNPRRLKLDARQGEVV